MLRSMDDLERYRIGATDGDIGHVKDFLFEDDTWAIRYLVVATGAWLPDQKVLISPIAVKHPDWMDKVLLVSITREQVRNSPAIDTDQPVSRQHETDYLGYYGFPCYWGGDGLWGAGVFPNALSPGHPGNASAFVEPGVAYARAETLRHQHDDHHLRSCHAVMGYHIRAKDGEIGYVCSLLVDEQTWAIRYLVVDTSNWLIGHTVLISPDWIGGVHWANETVSVNLDRQSIKGSPPYHSTHDLNRDQEAKLYGHYNRPVYWHANRAQAHESA